METQAKEQMNLASRRWAARMLDYWSVMFVGCIIAGIALSTRYSTAEQVKELQTTLMKEQYLLQLIQFGATVGCFVVDGLIYAICGNTLGKKIFGLKVVDEKGERISGLRYFLRNGDVLLSGCWCMAFFPITLLANFLQCRRVVQSGVTSYDARTATRVIRV